MNTEQESLRDWPHDLPGVEELLMIVRDYLSDDLGPRTEGRDRWMLRIAANALAIAARQVRSSPHDRAAHAERLASLGIDSEQELAEAIRNGLLDDRRGELAEALWATTLDKLAVANPSYEDVSNQRAPMLITDAPNRDNTEGEQ